MSSVLDIRVAGWEIAPSPDCRAALALENGDVLFLSTLRFDLRSNEYTLCSSGTVAGQKNVSFDPSSGRVSGTTLGGDHAQTLKEMLNRFSRSASALADGVLPRYRGRLQRGRASFRPAEVAGRATSWRNDDTRLHVDAFPASPVHGKRILRVFTNVNPNGRPRSWRLGEAFELVVERFASKLRMPMWGSAELLRLLRITNTRRSAYDALMLQLHDRMKTDTDYQTQAPGTPVDFPAGTTWMAFTDQVSHAATAGQFQLEQTFYLPVDGMLDARRSPLRVLERFKGRRLA